MLIPLIVGLVLLAIGIFLFFTTGVWLLSIQGEICGFLNIPLPNEAIGNTKYWCHSA